MYNIVCKIPNVNIRYMSGISQGISLVMSSQSAIYNVATPLSYSFVINSSTMASYFPNITTGNIYSYFSALSFSLFVNAVEYRSNMSISIQQKSNGNYLISGTFLSPIVPIATVCPIEIIYKSKIYNVANFNSVNIQFQSFTFLPKPKTSMFSLYSISNQIRNNSHFQIYPNKIKCRELFKM